MRMTAVEQGKRPADYIEQPQQVHVPTDLQQLTREAARRVGTLDALAGVLDVSRSAPGNWARGVYSPSRKYRERMRAIVEGDK